MKTVMKTTVRVLPTGEVEFLGKEIPFEDALGVVLINTVDRLILSKQIDYVNMFKMSAKCLSKEGSDNFAFDGSFSDMSYRGLLGYMKKMGYCEKDNDIICVASMSRDLFPDY